MSPLAKWCGICLMTLVTGLIPAHSVAARNLTAVEQAALTEAVDHYSTYLKTQDWRAMLEASIPPRMLDEMVGGRAPAPVLEPDNRDDYRSYDCSEGDAEDDWKTI